MSRRTEVLAADGTWRPAPTSAVRAGDVFRLFESDGSPVADEEGCRRWRALADAALNASGTYDLDAEALPESEVERAVALRGAWFPAEAGADLPSRSRLKP